MSVVKLKEKSKAIHQQVQDKLGRLTRANSEMIRRRTMHHHSYELELSRVKHSMGNLLRTNSRNSQEINRLKRQIAFSASSSPTMQRTFSFEDSNEQLLHQIREIRTEVSVINQKLEARPEPEPA